MAEVNLDHQNISEDIDFIQIKLASPENILN
jgi:hypothetical protein